MALETRLEPRLEQKLKLTQELRASIELLQLNELDLEGRLEEELLVNPFLSLEPEPEPWEERVRLGTDYSLPEEEEEGDWLSRQAGETSLWENLLWQIQVSPFPEDTKALAEKLLEHLSEEGFLRETDRELSEILEVPEERIRAARELLFTLEPEGIGAEGPLEAMLIQLKERGEGESLAARILRECREELEAGDWQGIGERLAVPPEELAKARETLKGLRPYPLLGTKGEKGIYYLKPDLLLKERPDGGFEVTLYEEKGRKRLHLRNSPLLWEKLTPQEKQYIREKTRAGKLLLRSLSYRELTLLRIAEYIIMKQGHILLYGENQAVPLTMREIAEALNLHESTVSRTIQNKTILTPRGLRELKSFLRHGGVEQFTPYRIQQRIREIISQENPQDPLSDEEIRMRLKREGIEVARRTIAKYRAALGIPGQKERRKDQAPLPCSLEPPPASQPSPAPGIP